MSRRESTSLSSSRWTVGKVVQRRFQWCSNCVGRQLNFDNPKRQCNQVNGGTHLDATPGYSWNEYHLTKFSFVESGSLVVDVQFTRDSKLSTKKVLVLNAMVILGRGENCIVDPPFEF